MGREMDRKIDNKVLQLGSLNDAIKSSVIDINKKNEERNTLASELEVLKSETDKQTERILKALTKVKTKSVKEQLKYRVDALKVCKQCEFQMKYAKKDLDSVLRFTIKLKSTTSDIEKRIVILKEEKEQLKGVEGKLAKFKQREAYVLNVTKELPKLSNEKKELKEDIRSLKVKKVGLDEVMKTEKTKQRAWLKETNKNAMAELERAKNKTDAIDQRRRDLLIVESRLKKVWKDISDKTFPKMNIA